MSIQANFPNVQPSLLLDFANAKQLPPSVTFNRATTATYYDGSTTAMAEQNLLQYSQDWSSVWGLNATATTVTANSTTAPNGTNTATQFSIASTTSLLHYAEQNFGTFSGQITASAYFKAGTQNFLNIAIYSAGFGNAYSVAFDLSTGAITKTTSVGSVTNVSSTITSVGSGWYRVTVTATFPTALAVYLIFATNSVSNPTYNYQNILESYSGTIGQSFYVWGAQAEQRSSATAYTATTTQAITNYIPALLTAGGGQPRFDHNPTTGESLGLLIEEQRTNLFTYSSDFSNAVWGKSQSSIVSNTNVAPDGTVTADEFVENTANDLHRLTTPNFAAGTYTLSVYAKADTRTKFEIVTQPIDVGFDLSAGTVLYGTGGTITPVGNGWYRCSVTFTQTITATMGYGLLNASGQRTYTGDGYSGIFIWGAQLEAGSFPTSYIPTTSAAATRAVDAVTMTGAAFASFNNSGQFTVICKASRWTTSFVTNQESLWSVAQSSPATVVSGLMLSGLSYRAYYESAADLTVSSAWTANTSSTFAQAYQTNNFAACANGGSVSTDSSGDMGVSIGFDTLYIGRFTSPANQFNGWMQKFAYYPQRVTNAQLQALTS